MKYLKYIIGNNHLISIAYTASSPTQAANIAQLAGYTKDQIRGVREAAKIKRDCGTDEFNRLLSPWEEADIQIKGYDSISVTLKIDRLYEQRPLNAKELNTVIDKIEMALRGLQLKLDIQRANEEAFVKDTLS